MLVLCIVIFLISIIKFFDFSNGGNKVEFSKFIDQISKLEKKIELEKKYISSNSRISKKSNFTNSKKDEIQLSVELNSADTIQLMKIYGIGSVLSKRIIKYRDLLGGYNRKNQLLDVYGMDTSVFNKFKHQIFIDLSLVQKIDINFVTANELSKHPFINFKLANNIVNYRDNHGFFLNKKELLDIYLIDSVTYNKIIPYIKLND